MTAGDKYLAGQPTDNGKRKADRSHVRPVEEKHRKVARDVLRKGKSIYESLIAAGYSEKQAGKGMQRVQQSHVLRVAFQEEAQRIEQDAKKAPLFPTEGALEGLIMSRLEKNIIKGEDKAVMSCKLAGSHRKLNLWTQDSVTGIVIVNAPNVLAHPREVPEDSE